VFGPEADGDGGVRSRRNRLSAAHVFGPVDQVTVGGNHECRNRLSAAHVFGPLLESMNYRSPRVAIAFQRRMCSDPAARFVRTMERVSQSPFSGACVRTI
jgi:hypothetical protein